MKQAQWAGAIVVLAAMVFAITFAMNYLGGGGGKPPVVQAKVVHQLRFDFPFAPVDGRRRECETGPRQSYHHDFWFQNEHAEDVKIGLDSTSCKCSSVQLYVLPDAGRARLLAFYAGQPAQATGRRLPLLSLWPSLSELPIDVAVHQGLQGTAEGHELLQKEGPLTVPAGAVGWVRLNWKGQDTTGPASFTGRLWADEKGGPSIALQVAVLFQRPLRVRSQLVLPTLRDEDLQGDGHTVQIVCWSSTRPKFGLKARLSTGRANAAANPFSLGKPRRLNRVDLAKLSARNNAEKADESGVGRVLSGYRVPITLKNVAADGKTPFPLGPFRRWVTLTMDDEEVEPVPVEVSGRVLGLVEVEGDEGVLSFDEAFRRSRGAQASTTLRSSIPGLILALDREQTRKAAPFLRVDEKLLAAPKSDSDGQNWTLRVTIPANEARGRFPRPEDPDYEDSAVYLRARQKDKPERTIRIPVVGTALEG